ncbi:MAG: ArnT family glycosyltransferase [Spirochaetia bacterium]
MKWSSQPLRGRQILIPAALLLLYLTVHLLFLTRFPFVHSDESWLAGLSRHMLAEGYLGVTEPFFDIYDRYPHAIKVLFHAVQMGFIGLFGHSIFTVRLVSLLFSCAALLVFYRLASRIVGSREYGLLAAVLLAADIQYIYASHFARQEIFLLFFFLSALFLFYRSLSVQALRRGSIYDLCTGLILGTAIGFHPNAFVIFLPLLYLYGLYFSRGKRKTLSQFAVFLMPILGGAALFAGLSFRFDPGFIGNYLSYGSTYGVDASLGNKIIQLGHYYYKLFHRVTGTYYLPGIKGQLIVFGLAMAVGVGAYIFSRVSPRKIGKREPGTSATAPVLDLAGIVVALNIGILLIGKYNVTNVIFIFPPMIILVMGVINLPVQEHRTRRYIIPALPVLLLSATLVSSILQVLPWIGRDHYREYLEELADTVPPDVPVLANLNTDFYFRNGVLKDYRNLVFLPEKGLAFPEYIRDRNIEYVIYPDEMDYIYNHRPIWNILYGNVWLYYEEMNRFLDEECTVIGEFTAPIYGMRIVRYIGDEDWKVRIYRVNPHR